MASPTAALAVSAGAAEGVAGAPAEDEPQQRDQQARRRR